MTLDPQTPPANVEDLAFSSKALVPTAKASSYLQQLCKHFGHKIPAEFTESQGRVEFPAGPCLLAASADGLALSVHAADEEGVAKLEDVIARHLLRFAFREELSVDWQRG